MTPLLAKMNVDILVHIGSHVVRLCERPVEVLDAIFTITPALSRWADDHISRLWKQAHDAQFGPVPPQLAVLTTKPGFSWRAFGLRRVRIIRSRLGTTASYVMREYRLSPSIRYSPSQIAVDMGVDAVHVQVIVDAVKLLRPILLSYMGNPIRSPYPFHLTGHNGVSPPFLSLARRGVSIPPFPGRQWPTHAFAVTTVSSEHSVACATEVSVVLALTRRLIKATCAVTDTLLPVVAPAFWDVILPPDGVLIHTDGYPRQLLVDLPALFSQTRILTEPFALIFSPPSADPYMSPVRWAGFFGANDEGSTIGYAYSGDTICPDYNTTTYGAAHCDCIIAITLKALRLYQKWLTAVEWDEQVSPGMDILIEQVGLEEPEAAGLHELLVRLRLPPVPGRVPGSAIPPLA